MKSKKIKQILKNADPRTEKLISSEFPANWDMESVFQKSYNSYLKQKKPDQAAESDGRRIFRKHTNNPIDTGFFLRTPAIAACLLLTFCTAGAILYILQRTKEPEQLRTDPTDVTTTAWTLLTATQTSMPADEREQTETTPRQTTYLTSFVTSRRIETVTVISTGTAITVLPPQQHAESSPSDSAVNGNGTGPGAGTGAVQTNQPPERPSGGANVTTETTTVTETTPAETAAPEPQEYGFCFEPSDQTWADFQLVYHPETPADPPKLKYSVSQDCYILTEDQPLQNGEETFNLTLTGRDTVSLSRQSYSRFIRSCAPGYTVSQEERNGKHVILLIAPGNSEVIFIWEQDQSIFSFVITVLIDEQDEEVGHAIEQGLTFIENLESSPPD